MCSDIGVEFQVCLFRVTLMLLCALFIVHCDCNLTIVFSVVLVTHLYKCDVNLCVLAVMCYGQSSSILLQVVIFVFFANCYFQVD